MKTRVLIPVILAVLSAHVATAQSWKYIAPMKHARGEHRAVLLQNGKILVIGGQDGNSALQSCELYDPNSDTWTEAASLNVARYRFQAFVLNDGRVFVAGGLSAIGINPPTLTTATCEIYDPNKNEWSLAASMSAPREGFAACKISDGRIAVFAGLNANDGSYPSSCEVYDPKTGQFSSLPPIPTPAAFMSAVYDPVTNTAFIPGGTYGFLSRIHKLTQAFGFSTGTWSSKDTMLELQGGMYSTILAPTNDCVIVSGGNDYLGHQIGNIEEFDVKTQVWRFTDSIDSRWNHNATLVDDSILITGGVYTLPSSLEAFRTACWWYNPTTGRARLAPPLLEGETNEAPIYYGYHKAAGSCILTKSFYVFGGRIGDNLFHNRCEVLELADSMPISSDLSLHRSIAASYYGLPDSLPMLLDVNASINLDSIWPTIKQISGTYSWDSSVVRFAGYIPPNGWTTTGLVSHGNSEDFTIQNLASSPTHPLDLGTALFLPKVQTLTASNVDLQNLTLQAGSKLLTPCLSSNEDQHWAVKVLGLEGVESSSEVSGFSIDWTRIENGVLTVGYHSPEYSRDIRFELYDIVGRKVRVIESIGTNPLSINIQDLSEGTYLLRASDRSSVISRMIIK